MKYGIPFLFILFFLEARSQDKSPKLFQNKAAMQGLQVEYKGVLLDPYPEAQSNVGMEQAVSFWEPQEWMIQEFEQKAGNYFYKKRFKPFYKDFCPCTTEQSKMMVRQYLAYTNRKGDYVIRAFFIKNPPDNWQVQPISYHPHCFYIYNFSRKKRISF